MNATDFPEFFRELNGVDPFPWQQSLAERVLGGTSSPWPEIPSEVVALPTSAGKTAIIDIAVFHLAVEANSGADRIAPLRIFFVVDRRIVVDEAFDRANKIARKLNEAQSGILKDVAERLRSFGGDTLLDDPLHVAMMRGGIYRDDVWAKSPAQPTVCVSTVDQVGSRLLFRGYGVTEFQRPIHAGLIAHDSLIVVDEAHISQPFVETLEAVRDFMTKDDGRAWAEVVIPRPLRVVQMTATPPDGAKPFELSSEDLSHPVLKIRLEAEKIARLVEVPVEKDAEEKNRETFAKALVAEAIKLVVGTADEVPLPKKGRAKKGAGESPKDVTPARVIGIVVNRVATARRVLELLESKTTTDPVTGHDVPFAHAILMTGRIRPFDRDELLYRVDVPQVMANQPTTEDLPASLKRGWLQFMKAGRSADDALVRPLFVVATQTIEVGANLDFDALVSEAAPLDALRQRFGRLDRLGRRQRSIAVVLVRKDTLTVEDPVYGDSIRGTWDFLNEVASGAKQQRVVDFGILKLKAADRAYRDGLQAKLLADARKKNAKKNDKQASEEELLAKVAAETKDRLAGLASPRQNAPVMLPSHVETWCQTSPTPSADPDVSLFLHGKKSGPADVHIVWRADLLTDDGQELEPGQLDRYVETVASVPPSSIEALPIPIYIAKAWLKQLSGVRSRLLTDLTDTEGDVSQSDEDFRARHKKAERLVLRWRGTENSKLVTSEGIFPGDTLIVPTQWCGYDRFGWNPECKDEVADIGDPCELLAHGRAALRLHPSVVRSWVPKTEVNGASLLTRLKAAMPSFGEDADENPNFNNCLQIIRAWPQIPIAFAAVCHAMSSPRPLRYADNSAWLVSSRQRLSLVELRRLFGSGDDAPLADVAPDSTQDDDGTSCVVAAGAWVSLVDHCRAVSELARRFASAIGMSDFIDDLELAGWLHDIGKAEYRFQIMLHGDEVRAAGGPLLAKSGLDPRDRAAFRRSFQRSGLPAGFRHESTSVALIDNNESSLAQARDQALIRFLIGTHHGRGRPFQPAVIDDSLEVLPFDHACDPKTALHFQTTGDHRLYHLDQGWTDLFWQMVHKYGPWGVAFLETLLRLADQRQSHLEQTTTRKEPQR